MYENEIDFLEKCAETSKGEELAAAGTAAGLGALGMHFVADNALATSIPKFKMPNGKVIKKVVKLVKRGEEIPGGKAEGLSSSDFNQRDLAKGIEVEKEHTADPRVAEEISKDHIIEVKKKDDAGKWTSSYYDKMPAFEKEVEKTSSLKDLCCSMWNS